MKRAGILSGIVIVIAVLTLGLPRPGVREPQVPSSPRQVGALGYLEPEGRVIRIAGPGTIGSITVLKLLVEEGDSVEAGQPIAILDSHDPLSAAFRESEARVRLAEIDLSDARERLKVGAIQARAAAVSRIEAELEFRQKQRDRIESRWRRNEDVSESAWDDARTAATAKAEELSQAKAELADVAHTRQIAVDRAEVDLRLATESLARAKAELDLATVTSPLHGRVIKVHTRAGERVGERGIAELGRTDQMFAVAEIYQSDVPLLRVGQRATVRPEGIEGEIGGTVERIGLQVQRNQLANPDPAVDVDVRVVEVRIRLDDSSRVSGLTNLRVTCIIQP